MELQMIYDPQATVDMTKEEYIELHTILWKDAQDMGCNCPAGNPPCGFCEDGFSVPLEEYLDNIVRGHIFQPSANSYENYDRAMKGFAV